VKTKARFLRFALIGVLLNLALIVSAAPPSISFQPQSQTVVLYQPAAFGVIAGGSALFSYQWRKEGMPIAGATNDLPPQFRFGRSLGTNPWESGHR